MSTSPRALWVEILSRQREVVARHRIEGDEARIGRGYDNDVIVDDPYVAARHLRVFRDESGALAAEDLGSANGSFVGSGQERLTRLAIDGDQVIRIGRSYLRIREASQTVAEERVAKPRVRIWPITGALIGVVLGIELADVWLRETTEPKMADYFIPLLTVSLLIAGWATAWAILSRIFAGRARFGRNLLIGAAGLLVFSLFNEVTEYGAFALSLRELTAYRYVGMWLIAAAVCFMHLRAISMSRATLKLAVVGTLALAAIGMQTLSQLSARAWADHQTYVRRLKPPELRLAAQQSERAFFKSVAGLKDKLDRARTEQLSESGDYYGADDD